ncbi:hypothetical protein Trydic_g15034 [Trypoxylus dichotomus]
METGSVTKRKADQAPSVLIEDRVDDIRQRMDKRTAVPRNHAHGKRTAKRNLTYSPSPPLHKRTFKRLGSGNAVRRCVRIDEIWLQGTCRGRTQGDPPLSGAPRCTPPPAPDTLVNYQLNRLSNPGNRHVAAHDKIVGDAWGRECRVNQQMLHGLDSPAGTRTVPSYPCFSITFRFWSRAVGITLYSDVSSREFSSSIFLLGCSNRCCKWLYYIDALFLDFTLACGGSYPWSIIYLDRSAIEAVEHLTSVAAIHGSH